MRRDRYGADRETVAEAFGHRIDIGVHAGPVGGVVLAATSATALDLVGDVQSAVAVAQRADLANEPFAGHPNASYALNILDNHRRNVPALESGLERRLVVERNEHDMVRPVDRGHDRRIVGRRDGQRGAAVKSAFHRDHLAFACDEGSELHRIFVGLGSRIAQEKLVIPLAGQFAQLRGQLALLIDDDRIGIETDMLQLVDHFFHVVRMGMADRDDGMSAVHIEITGSLVVPHVRALGPDDIDIPQRVNFEQIHN